MPAAWIAPPPRAEAGADGIGVVGVLRDLLDMVGGDSCRGEFERLAQIGGQILVREQPF